jgi:uncharacterized C2H2 Zn-finger protein
MFFSIPSLEVFERSKKYEKAKIKKSHSTNISRDKIETDGMKRRKVLVIYTI